MKKFAFLFVLLSMPFYLLATHIVGGEIYYTCLGNNEYEITLKVYRDCINGQAPFDNPAYLTIYDGSNLSTPFLNPSLTEVDSISVPVIINNPCLQAPPNICVREATYKYIVTLPPNAAGYFISYQRCCRNNSILNLTAPGDQGSTYMCFVPPQSLASCNSSPRYNEFPPIALCAGEQLIFNHSATDPDGDLLVYELCDAYQGANSTDPYPTTAPAPAYPFVNYGFGYSASFPMPSSPALAIDPNTGVLTVTPSQVGQYVVAVCVKEYRNGQLISTNKRDFQFNVVNCTTNVIAAIPDQTSFCLGRNVSFSNSSVNSTFYHWDFGVTNLTDDTSNLETPSYSYQDTGTYQISLIANPGWPCADTAILDYVVKEYLEADIPSVESQCFNGNDFSFQAGGVFQSYSTFSWNFGASGNPSTSTLKDPTDISFNAADTFRVFLTIESDGCFSTDSLDVMLYENPISSFNLIPQTGCAPFKVNFTNTSQYEFGLDYLWDFGDGRVSTQTDPFNIFSDPGQYTVSLTVMSDFGCKDTVMNTAINLITVLPTPTAMLEVDTLTASQFDPEFNFQDISSGSVDCRLEFSTGVMVDTCDLKYRFEGDTGAIVVKQIVTNDLGCPDVNYVYLYIQPEYVFYIPNSFTPNGDKMNETFKPVGMGAKEFKIEIYNRWGELVFRSNNFNEGWDGTYRGQDLGTCPSDVYAYKLYLYGVDLETRLFYGHVTLVR
ncbi:MAG: gliding motility-associated C-terminal domain-containing protein [Bacteroidia bacterium]|nr:gliding motility-associated C-terminal domain-containing protein [Bacteroidia bacterium]